MAAPTVNVTPGTGATLNALGAASALQANAPTVGIATDQTIPISGTVGTTSSAAVTNPTSTLTRPANTTAYAASDLIASNVTAGSIVVPSFAIANSAGGSIIQRLRLSTNATTGWDAVQVMVSLWTAAPTYTNGDNGAYAVATNGATLLGQFQIALSQFGDAAAGAGVPTVGNSVNAKLASGTSVFWDVKILGAATPISGQTFTLTPELLN